MIDEDLAAAHNKRRREKAQALKARNGKLYALARTPGGIRNSQAPRTRRSATAGNAGQGSNWIRRDRRLRIYDRDAWRCVWCCAPVGTPAEMLREPHLRCATLDHFLARSKGGTNRSENLITSCMQCNHDRGHMSALEWAAKLEERNPRGVWVGNIAAILERCLRALEKPLPPQPPKVAIP